MVAVNVLAWATEGAATNAYAIFLASLFLDTTYQRLINYTTWGIRIWTVVAIIVGTILLGLDIESYVSSCYDSVADMCIANRFISRRQMLFSAWLLDFFIYRYSLQWHG